MAYKIVYNNCYGGFGLSDEAELLYFKLAGIDASTLPEWEVYDLIRGVSRHDPHLITVVETLGVAANGVCARLRIEEISGPIYKIEEYDGNETVIPDWSEEWICAK